MLKATGRKVVFAESCTGGLVSGALTAIPGISDYHCGGVVVYRNQTKMAYLQIPARLLDVPGPVSAEVAKLMAQKVLEKTPEAAVAVSVTGHLGPDAPAKLDGRVYVGLAWRSDSSRRSSGTSVRSLWCPRDKSRAVRQRWLVEKVLALLAGELNLGGRQ